LEEEMELRFNQTAADVIIALMLVAMPLLIALCIHTKRRIEALRQDSQESQIQTID
jgi:hypothetical protein